MKKPAIILTCVFFYSCTVQQPINIQPSDNNKDYRVEYLFEHDGCKVYRFFDRGNTVYFTNCKGDTISKRDSLEVRNSTKIIMNQ